MSEIKSSRSLEIFSPSWPSSCSAAERSAEIGLRANQVDDCFGLRQVEFAIQKSALGEFTRTRRPRACAQAGLPDARRDQHAAVATDFHDVFAGVARRRAMDREHHLIDDTLFLDDLAELLKMRSRVRRFLFAAKIASATAIACGPESLTSAMAPSPGGVETAAIVAVVSAGVMPPSPRAARRCIYDSVPSCRRRSAPTRGICNR